MWGWVLKQLVRYLDAHPEKLEALIRFLIGRLKARNARSAKKTEDASLETIIWSD